MERLFETIKNGVLNFKLNLCCFIFSVRVGILLFASYNLITSVLALIAVMTSSFPSLYMHAQQIIMDGEYVPSSGAFAYCAEICSNILLLCGVFRKDIILLRYFTYVGLVMAAATVLVYAMVIDVLDMLSTIILIISLTSQIYVVLLVRSYIVDIQNAAKNDYVATWRKSYMEPIYYKPEEKYTVVIEPETTNEVSLADETSGELSAREIIEIIEANEVKDDIIDVKDQTNNEKDVNEVKDNTNDVKHTRKEVKDSTNEVKDVTKDVKRTTSEVKDSSSTNEAKDHAAEASTSRQPSANVPLRYPYKFIAIKIPKEKTIKEEGSSEDVKIESSEKESVNKKSDNKELNKDVMSEGSKDAKKPPKLPIRTIFGRKKKRKNSETTVDELKKT